jgi:hypothetical protein
MEIQRFGVTTTIFVDAVDAGEAALIIERDLAGRFDSDLVSVSAHAKTGDGACCPACGSERIEHHEDMVARRHSIESVLTASWYSTALPFHSMTTVCAPGCGAGTVRRNGTCPSRESRSNDRYALQNAGLGRVCPVRTLLT